MILISRSRKRCCRFIGIIIFILQVIGLASSTDDNIALANEDDEGVHEEEPSYCIDRGLNCRSWTLAGECRKDGSYKYMKLNCPVSCNYCNPMLERWEPRDKSSANEEEEEDDDDYYEDDEGHSPLTRKFDRVPIYHGVAQQTNFSASPFTKNPIKFVEGQMPGDEYYKLRVLDILEAMDFYLNEIYSDEMTFVNPEGFDVHPSTPYATLKAYSPADIESTPYGARIPQLESCINRHPNCALWAALGYCDSSRETMSQMCTPVCQSCDVNIPSPHSVTVEPGPWRYSPYERLDLNGILEDISEDRIIVRSFDVAKQHVPNNIKLEYRTKMTKLTDKEQYLNLDQMTVHAHRVRRSEKDREIYSEALKVKGSGLEYSSLLTLRALLSREDCQALLDTVSFGVGVTSRMHGETAEDGFPEKTVDVVYNEEGEEIVMRKSSRVNIYPSIRNNDGSMKYSNAIERLLVKINLMTGINAAYTVEAPIVFEKFEAGDFSKPTRHFRSGILLSEEQEYQDYIMVKGGEEYEDMDQPDLMENARIFGLKVFLNGISRIDEGGQVVFPHFPQLEFHPLVGAAILFPTVASLIDQNIEKAKNSDDNLTDGGTDSSFLVEDMYTIYGHEPVTARTKYCVTLYFRRYELEDRLPE